MNGARAIGVLWGYGSQEELAEIGFSLVLRLSGLLRHSGVGSDA